MRRPAAVTMAAALIALAVPTTAGAAVGQGGSISYVGGDEKTGQTATYSFECSFSDEQEAEGAQAYLFTAGGGSFLGYGSGLSFSSNTPTERIGTFQMSYAGRAAGTYQIRVECFGDGVGGSVIATREVTVAASAATTTTSLQASPQSTFPGHGVTLTATVPGAVGGTVDFTDGYGSLGSVPLGADHTASITQGFPETTSVTATYSGAEGYAGSSSSPVVVTVVDHVTAPASVTISEPVRVGEPASVTDLGTWSPSGVTYTYVWKVDGQQVGTGTTYTPVPADLDKPLTVEVTGTHPSLGAPGAATAPSASARWINPGVLATGDWDLTGTDADGNAVLGTPLAVVTAGWPAGTTFTYQWEVDYADVPGATSATYTPRVADLGKVVNVRVDATAPGMGSEYDVFYAWSVVTTPTVTVGSSQITVGSDAVVPVTVAGPAGGPVPTGTVDVTLTPTSGTPVVRSGVALVGGSASVTVHDLAVGTYAVSVAYSGEGQMHPTFMLMSLPQSHAYLPATGSGTVLVVKPAPVVTPADLTVPVATAGTLDVQIGAPRPERFVVREGSTVLVEGVVPATGTSLRIALPVLAPGAHDLVIDLPESATTAAASRAVRVTVTGEPPRASGTPTAELATPKGATAPGQQMDLVAEGFEPGETVAFYLHSDPVFLGTAVAGADGIARLRATVPSDVPLGTHTVIATGGTSGRWAQLSVVLGLPTATTPALAATGAQAGGLMTGAWLLLVLGGGLVVVARKVRAAR